MGPRARPGLPRAGSCCRACRGARGGPSSGAAATSGARRGDPARVQHRVPVPPLPRPRQRRRPRERTTPAPLDDHHRVRGQPPVGCVATSQPATSTSGVAYRGSTSTMSYARSAAPQHGRRRRRPHRGPRQASDGDVAPQHRGRPPVRLDEQRVPRPPRQRLQPEGPRSAHRSSTAAPSRPGSATSALNSASRTRSDVGRVPAGGTAIRRPPATPAMIRVTAPSSPVAAAPPPVIPRSGPSALRGRPCAPRTSDHVALNVPSVDHAAQGAAGPAKPDAVASGACAPR